MHELLKMEKDFQRGRIVVIGAIVCSLIVSVASVALGFYYTHQQGQRIYVVNRGSAIEATCGDVGDNRLAEIRYQVRKFHELFFSVSPDQASISANLRKALYLCDESANQLYLNLTEGNYYREMIEGNVTQKVSIDSIQVDMTTYPYRVRAFGQLAQERSSAIASRSIVTSAELVDVNRSENSPNGLLMRNFHIDQTQLLSETAR